MDWVRKFRNPVLEKEIRIRMRTLKSPVAIFFYLLVLGFFEFFFVYTQTQFGRVAFNPTQSKELFMLLSFVQLALIAFVTPGLTSGEISGERERQTLNILLTTQQSSASIILGKLVSSIAFLGLMVLATLPFYSMVFLFGGISPKQLAITFAFFLFTMFVIGSWGIFYSTLFRKTMLATIVTYGTVLFFFAGTAFISILIEMLTRGPGQGTLVSFHLLGLNPAAALLSIFEPEFTRSIAHSRTSLQVWQLYLVYHIVLSTLIILASIKKLRRV